jgi:hypothetical protein
MYLGGYDGKYHLAFQKRPSIQVCNFHRRHSEPSPRAASFRLANIQFLARRKALDIPMNPIVGGVAGLHGHRLPGFLKPIIRVTYQYQKGTFVHDFTLV